MIEVMIPDIYWDGDYWVIKKVSNINELDHLLKYCDGSIPNLVIETKTKMSAEEISCTLEKHNWIEKIIIKNEDGSPSVYERK